MSSGGSPEAGGAGSTKDTPQLKRPKSPEKGPSKRQRQHFEETRGPEVIHSDEETAKPPGEEPAEASASRPSKPRGVSGSKDEDYVTANKKLVDKTATVKVKPGPLSKVKGSLAKQLERRKVEEKKKPVPVEKELYPELVPAPRKYGYWSGTGAEDRPRALILFSGRARPGDLHQSLVRLGWTVCSVDTLSPKPTNILDDAIDAEIQKDLVYGYFQALWVATPCGTFSPLREKQPGPRVLRSVNQITGLRRSELTAAEQKQLKEANLLVGRSAKAIHGQRTSGGPWGLENPDHPKDKPSIWLMPAIEELALRDDVDLVGFDQCRFGLETTKPTIFMSQKMDFSEVDELRCNHPKVEHTDAKGNKYRSAHESTVQRWIETEHGRERASKSQGEYTVELSRAIARAFHHNQKDEAWLVEDLRDEPL